MEKNVPTKKLRMKRNIRNQKDAGLGVKMIRKDSAADALYLISRIVERYPAYVREISDFRFDHTIGKGGYGEVWLAYDLRTGKYCAVKELQAEKVTAANVSSFIREVQTMIIMRNSRFILQFVGFTVDSPFSIITEYVPNGSLLNYTHLSKIKAKLSGTHLTINAMCIAFAMIELHKKKMIHRDLKCANILMDSNFLPMICDFGTTRLVVEDRRMTSRIGTVTHMAPEIMFEQPYGFECDIYSYAMILFEMSQGRYPYGGSRELIIQKIKDIVRPKLFNRQTPKCLALLMARCWNQDMKKRPSFTEIYTLFKEGKVFFWETDIEKVKRFAAEIEKLGSRNLPPPPKNPSIDIKSILDRMERQYKKMKKEEEEEVAAAAVAAGMTPEAVESLKSVNENRKVKDLEAFNLSTRSRRKSLKNKNKNKDPENKDPENNEVKERDVKNFDEEHNEENNDNENNNENNNNDENIGDNENNDDENNEDDENNDDENIDDENIDEENNEDDDNNVNEGEAKDSTSDESHHVKEILSNPDNALFEPTLHSYADNLGTHHFRTFCSIIAKHFSHESNTSPSVICLIIDSVVAMANRDSAFIEQFELCHFFTILPNDSNENIRNSVFNLIWAVFSKRPDLVKHSLFRTIGRLLLTDQERSLALFSFYARKYDEVDDPFILFDFLLSYARAFVDIDEGTTYIDIFYYLFENYPEFRQMRLEKFSVILAAMCESRNRSVAFTAIRALADLYENSKMKVPFRQICKNLMDRQLARPSISLLKRVDQYPHSRSLFRLLIKNLPSSTSVILKFVAECEENAKIAAENVIWFQSQPTISVRILMLIFKYPKTLFALFNNVQFPLYIASLTSAKNNEVIFSLGSIIKRLPLDQLFIDTLTSSGFFRGYSIVVSKAADDLELVQSCNSLLDTLTRTGYSPDYILFLPLLMKTLSAKNNSTKSAIAVLVSISCHRQLAQALKKDELIRYFSVLQKTKYKKQADIFLKNVNT